MNKTRLDTTEYIGFGGGCHWCTEAVFQQLAGVTQVKQGWIATNDPNNSFSEAISLSYDPNTISLKTLSHIHLLTHASTSSHSMRGKYRSAIYFSTQEQAGKLQVILAELQQDFDSPLVTQILPLLEFRINNDQFLNYYQKQPDAPFCQTYISPKLKLLQKQFARNLI